MSSSVARGCEKNRKSSINFVNPLVCAPDPPYNKVDRIPTPLQGGHMKAPRILVVGSISMDLIVTTGRFPETGETVTGIGFSTAPGGKGANQAVQAARLGADVTMVGRVGKDAFGKELLDSLSASGCVIDRIKEDSRHPTGVANVQIEQTAGSTNNRITVVPGANGALVPEDVDFLEVGISDFDLVMLQFEVPMAVNLRTAEYAQKAGVPVLLNTAPAEALPNELRNKITWLSANETETAVLTGILPSDNRSTAAAVSALLDQGIKKVLLTLGARGAVLGSREGLLYAPCAPGVTVVDPTAAGDSFLGAFAYAVCSGMPSEDALHFANRAAGITVSRLGAQPSLPTLTEICALP